MKTKSKDNTVTIEFAGTISTEILDSIYASQIVDSYIHKNISEINLEGKEVILKGNYSTILYLLTTISEYYHKEYMTIFLDRAVEEDDRQTISEEEDPAGSSEISDPESAQNESQTN